MKPFLAGLVLALTAGWVGFRPWVQPTVRQPLQFNHQAHKDIDCSGCHEGVTQAASAGLPKLEVCMTCHETAVTKSPEEEKIRTFARQRKEPEWQRLFKQPSHVFYSHRRHVEMAKLDCRECHGNIGESTTPPQAVRNLSMSGCISCHHDKGVQADCIDCHR